MFTIIPALNDNYIWLYAQVNAPVLIIDIPETTRLLPFLQQHNPAVEAVLLTHKHADHVAGVAEFRRHYPDVPVFGPDETKELGATHIVNEGEINLPHYRIQVLPTGGHTANHVSYLTDGHLFCGDTLFSAGCGRVFSGDYAQMFASLQRINALPAETLICPGHEYTLSNLAFAQSLQPMNQQLAEYTRRVQALRAQNRPSVPTTLALERQINPFLQAKTLAEFIRLRQAKDKA
ncbi:hydroxyacylglutathione hydrolase [Pasteurellaceae bacterium LIM206]|nr:hydroxyacylglutathione hydrolase [Pasteurellaceae bacterium LIM206]